jgi:hypothetical protein
MYYHTSVSLMKDSCPRVRDLKVVKRLVSFFVASIRTYIVR